MWHLVDHYLQTGGSFFGAKKAMAQPLHLLYSYDVQPPGGSTAGTTAGLTGGTVAIVNGLYEADGAGLTAEATQFDLAGNMLRTQSTQLVDAVAADGARSLFRLAPPPPATPARGTVLLRLRLLGRNSSDNWYWVPPVPDAFDLGHGCYTVRITHLTRVFFYVHAVQMCSV